MLKWLKDQTPNQMAAKSEGITARDAKANNIAIIGGRIEIQPGITLRLNLWIVSSPLVRWNEASVISEMEI